MTSNFSADVFLICLLEKKKTKWLLQLQVLYDYDFGPNYLRNVGIMNIGSVDPNFTGSRAIAGAGNAQPTIDLETFGTTKGILLPKDAKPKLQPWCCYL
jgi:hypothetical protein